MDRTRSTSARPARCGRGPRRQPGRTTIYRSPKTGFRSSGRHAVPGDLGWKSLAIAHVARKRIFYASGIRSPGSCGWRSDAARQPQFEITDDDAPHWRSPRSRSALWLDATGLLHRVDSRQPDVVLMSSSDATNRAADGLTARRRRQDVERGRSRRPQPIRDVVELEQTGVWSRR